MRCPDCNKFVGLENADPEIDLDLSEPDEDGSATISGTVRLVRTCAECSNELKETTFDVEHEIEIPATHRGDGHDLTLEHGDGEVTESGGTGRAKTMIGYALDYEIRCSCQKEKDDPIVSGNIADETNAGSFDELV